MIDKNIAIGAGAGFMVGFLANKYIAGVQIPREFTERHNRLDLRVYGHPADKPTVPTVEKPLAYNTLNGERPEGPVKQALWGTYALNGGRGGILVVVSGILCHISPDVTLWWLTVSRLDPLGVMIWYDGDFLTELEATGIPDAGLAVPGLYLKPLEWIRR